MHPQLLINAVVQQTMVLIAHLATAGGVRAPLANVANQVFRDLSDQLGAQGVSKNVIADMFGMALSTYHRRVRAASESQSVSGRSVWEAVLGFVREREPVSGAAVQKRFQNDDAAVVASILRDLVDSGMIYRSGRGADAVYRIANPEDFADSGGEDRRDAMKHIVWLAVVRRGPCGVAALVADTQFDEATCHALVEELVAERHVEARRVGTETLYESVRFDVPVGTSSGWEAAILDHFQAVVTALCVKLRSGGRGSAEKDAVGGATYTIDVWHGHPMEGEARTTLARVRESLNALRARVDRYNETNARPRSRAGGEVIFYAGQYVKTDDADADEGGGDDV